VPDYAANAGGVINGCRELLGWDLSKAMKKVDEIYDTILRVVQIATAERIPTFQVADRLAEERFNA